VLLRIIKVSDQTLRTDSAESDALSSKSKAGSFDSLIVSIVDKVYRLSWPPKKQHAYALDRLDCTLELI
jgi:hypothetical protein